jgi:sigma-B regulation protein RsbU (phosphoserine phosphatase)
MRYIQATLFPEFSDVGGFDIGSVFFPSEHLSGNFIDGFFLDKTIYQFAFCTISAKGIQSSFVGSAIRTLLRTQPQAPGVPSAIITEVNSKLSKIISGVKFLASIMVIQINTRTGTALMSSAGGQPVFLYHKKKNRLISPQGERPQVGGVAEDVYRDLSIQMEPGDSLLLYTGAILEESSEPAGEKYGEQRLMENYLKVAESASREIVRSVAESVYEFINYSRQKDDIIIINIKKS